MSEPSEYHKIQSIFKRDMANGKRLVEGDWTCPEFEYLANSQWDLTEKVDGTNIRVWVDEQRKLRFGGRTDRAQLPTGLLGRLSEQFSPEAFFAAFGETPDVCLYGEGYGAGIQRVGALYGQSQNFVLFDVRVGSFWLRRPDVSDVAKQFGIDVVPIVGSGTLHEAIASVRQGTCSRWGNFTSEGVVARPAVELQTRAGARIIAKIKHCDFVAKTAR